MANRLADATSPYLQQHRDNPVHWWEWQDEAFQEAVRRDVPVLLSVGYAACHWCHVMAHESFEDEATAAIMNQGFVCIKVDREERPDVDAHYMTVVQAMTGSGGWPMTAFLTPQGRAFHAGTYFPKQPVQGMPSFQQVLHAVAEAWRDRRQSLEDMGSQVVDRIRTIRESTTESDAAAPGAAELADAVRTLSSTFDQDFAGFGRSPKFPPSMTLTFLLDHHARTGSQAALGMAEQTCEAMARGGIYDQLGGGFSRYSVDQRWIVPHFEKMLYDNALLLRAYTGLYRHSQSDLARRVVFETVEFLLRDLRTDNGGFASSLDADALAVGADGQSDSVQEGASYVWTLADLRTVLGAEDAAWAADVLGVTEAGTFDAGASTLTLAADPADPPRFADVRERLRRARDRRPQPSRDDKVVTAWNGMTIAALAEAGMVFDQSDWIRAAEQSAHLLLDRHLDSEGVLRRVSRDGSVGDPMGMLEDYAWLAEACQTLFAATGQAIWFEQAAGLTDQLIARFVEGEASEATFFDTADGATDPRLGVRSRDPLDGATPSGQFVAAGVLLRHATYTGSMEHRRLAERALAEATPLVGRAPIALGRGLAVAEALQAGPVEVAVVGEADDAATQALLRTAWRSTSPGLVIAFAEPAVESSVPLLAGRGLLDGQPAAYVCRDFVCARPVNEPTEMVELIQRAPS